MISRRPRIYRDWPPDPENSKTKSRLSCSDRRRFSV